MPSIEVHAWADELCKLLRYIQQFKFYKKELGSQEEIHTICTHGPQLRTAGGDREGRMTYAKVKESGKLAAETGGGSPTSTAGAL